MLNIEELIRSQELFDGRYALIRPLSREGATADVWLALDTKTVVEKVKWTDVVQLSESEIDSLGLIVAIKIYRPQNALDVEGEQRFRDEYMIVFNCRHTNLIHPTSYAIFRETPYLVLPYCKKGSSELLVGKMVKERDIWKFIFDVASGLDYLHCSCKPPIIHQDIKPGNVLFDDYGNYAITDFGISVKHNGLSDEVSREISGTLAYMSPERFEEGNEPSAESDIWALGATLCELVAGSVPYGEQGGGAQKSGKEMVALPKGLPWSVKDVINRCLSLQVDKRPTAKELVKEASEHIQGRQKIYPYVVLVLILMGSLAAYFFWPESKPIENEEKRTAYQDALEMLLESATALRGQEILDSLSAEGNEDAKFMLSRLLFQPDDNNHYFSKEIEKLRQHITQHDNVRAHQLLEEVATQDTCKNYYALFEYANDFLIPEYKSLRENYESIYIEQKTKPYFENALRLSKESDNEVAGIIRQESKERLKKIVGRMQQHGLITMAQYEEYEQWLSGQ